MEEIINSVLNQIEVFNILKGIWAIVICVFYYSVSKKYDGNKKVQVKALLVGCLVFTIIMFLLEYKTAQLDKEIRTLIDADCTEELIKKGE